MKKIFRQFVIRSDELARRVVKVKAQSKLEADDILFCFVLLLLYFRESKA